LRRPEVAKLPSVINESKEGNAVQWLSRRIEVSFPGKAEVMAVSISGDDPKEIKALVKAVVDAYCSEVVNVEQDQKRSRLSELERICAEKELDMRTKRELLKSMTENTGISDSGALTVKTKLLLEELALYRNEIMKNQFELRRTAGELAGQKALLANAESMDVPASELDQMVQMDPQAKQLGIELGKKIAQIYSDEKGDYAGKDKDLARYKEDLHELQSQYDNRVEAVRKKAQEKRRLTVAQEVLRLETQLGAMQKQQESATKDIAKMQSEAVKIGTSSVEVEMLRSDLMHLDKSLSELSGEREKVRVELRAVPRISVLQEAEAVKN
jgi:polysaccharide biosynthesis transport protein